MLKLLSLWFCFVFGVYLFSGCVFFLPDHQNICICTYVRIKYTTYIFGVRLFLFHASTLGQVSFSHLSLSPKIWKFSCVHFFFFFHHPHHHHQQQFIEKVEYAANSIKLLQIPIRMSFKLLYNNKYVNYCIVISMTFKILFAAFSTFLMKMLQNNSSNECIITWKCFVVVFFFIVKLYAMIVAVVYIH